MTRDEIIEAVAITQTAMGLSHWEITVSFNPSSGPDEDVFAKCVPEPQYWRADISFNLDRCKNKEVVQKCIVHEMMHAVLSPYTTVAAHFAGSLAPVLENLEETVVTQIENWPFWGYATLKSDE